MLSTNPVALILHDFSSIRCCLGGAHFLSPCPGPPQVNDHHCLRYPVIGTYRSLLWVVLHNERILRGKRNLINFVFVLAFLCLLAVNTAALLYVVIIIIVIIISLFY